MIRPGQIQMKAGKWTIDTALPGFRPQKQPLDKFVFTALQKYKDGSVDPDLNAHIGCWIDQMKSHSRDMYRVIADDIKVCCKDTEDKFSKGLLEIAGWLNYLGMNIQTGQK